MSMSAIKLSALLFKGLKYSAGLIAIFVVISFIIYSIQSPSNNKNWTLEQNKTASIQINNDQVIINNFRDADWQNIDINSLESSDALFKNIEFKLSDIETLHTFVSHFSIVSEIAHIFIFFELKDKTMIGLSVEARKEKGEEYSLLGGLSAEFELIYIMGSYRDLVGLRLMRNEAVYDYPIEASAKEAQALFQEVVTRTNQLHQEPELYHLLLKNCTTQIVDLANLLTDASFSRLTQSFFTGDTGKALYNMGFVGNGLDFQELQTKSLLKNPSPDK